MAYIVPRVLIEQEFEQVAVFGDQPLAALVIGPQYNLYRYSEADEKPLTALTHPDDTSLVNEYQSSDDVVYTFPNQVAGTIVDESFVKLYLEKAEVKYYPNSVLGATSGATTRVTVPTVGGIYKNRIKADSLVFKTNDAADRSADLGDRDVKLGDLVTITSATQADTFTTKVKALHATKVASSLDAVTVDTDNGADSTEDFDDAPVIVLEDALSDVTVTNSSTGFKGGWLDDGEFVLTDTFHARVTTGGNLSASVFTVWSESGLLAETTGVEPDGSDEITFYTREAVSVKLDFSSSVLFTVGDEYKVTVVAPRVKATAPTAGGTYTGTVDRTYKLTVTRGGPFYDDTNADVCARVSVTSSDVDSSPSVNVKSATAFNVGSYGVTATWTTGAVEGGLVEGDDYYIPANAESDGAINIVETYDVLPADFTDNAITDWVIAKLHYQTDLEVPQKIPNNDVDLNWEVDVDASTITVNSGITTSNDDITAGGSAIPLDVEGGKLFVEHRDLVDSNSTAILSVASADEVEDALGVIHPDNPLAQGVYNAALNAAGVTVYYGAVPTNDLSGYQDILALAKKSDSYYGLVPLTHDRTIIDAVIGHVNALSTAQSARWRKTWVSVELKEEELILELNDDDENYEATITDDPLTSGTQYTLVTISGAELITDGVRPGDKVLINFRVDSDGETVYDEYEINEVRTETTLELVAGPAAAINSATKVQIQRVYSREEQIDWLKEAGSDFNNRRVNPVFPTVAKNGDVEQEGFQVAAALAGLRSGVVPHQGLTNAEVLGFTDLTQTVSTFTEDQLNQLAEGGYFIVTQDVVGGTPYVRHQLTSDSSSLNTSEDSVTTNVDSISYGLQRALRPYIGVYNAHPRALAIIRQAIDRELYFRATSTYTTKAGNQIISYKILKMEQNAAFKDRVDVEIQLEVPYPINFITVKLFV